MFYWQTEIAVISVAAIVITITAIIIVVTITVVTAISAIQPLASEIHFSMQTVREIMTVTVTATVAARILVYNQEDICKCY